MTALGETKLNMAGKYPNPFDKFGVVSATFKAVRELHPELPEMKIVGLPQALLKERASTPWYDGATALLSLKRFTDFGERIEITDQTVYLVLAEKGLRQRLDALMSYERELRLVEAIKAGRHSRDADLRRESVALIQRSSVVADGAVGYSGAIPHELYAWRILVEQADAAKIFTGAWADATPAGRLYILAALVHLGRPNNKFEEELEKQGGFVRTASGCSFVEHQDLRSVVREDVQAGSLARAILSSTQPRDEQLQRLRDLVKDYSGLKKYTVPPVRAGANLIEGGGWK